MAEKKNILDTNFLENYGVVVSSQYPGDRDPNNLPLFFNNSSLLIYYLKREASIWHQIESEYSKHHGENLFSKKIEQVIEKIKDFFSDAGPSAYQSQEGLLKEFNKFTNGKSLINIQGTYGYVFTKDDYGNAVQLLTDNYRRPTAERKINETVGTKIVFMNVFLNFPIIQEFKPSTARLLENVYTRILRYDNENSLVIMQLFSSLYLHKSFLKGNLVIDGSGNNNILNKNLSGYLKNPFEDANFIQQLYLYSKGLLIRPADRTNPKIITHENELSTQLDGISQTADELIQGATDKIFKASQEYIDNKNQVNEDLKDQLKTGKTDLEHLIQSKKEEFSKLKETYESELKLKEPAKFWESESKKYSHRAMTYSVLSVVAGAVIIYGVGYMVKLVFEDKNLTSTRIIPVFLIPALIISLTVYVLKTFINLAVSNTNYSMEFEQKRALTVYYLTMIHDGSVQNGDDEKKMILPALFSHVDTGLTKNNRSDDTSLEYIMNVLNRKS